MIPKFSLKWIFYEIKSYFRTIARQVTDLIIYDPIYEVKRTVGFLVLENYIIDSIHPLIFESYFVKKIPKNNKH